jgi:hypothetical protein
MLKWLANIVGSIFGLKAFIGGLFLSALAIILYNLGVEAIEEILNFTIAKVSGQNYGEFTNPSVTGFVGWVIAQLKLPECLSVIASCVAVRWMLRKIPFLRW